MSLDKDLIREIDRLNNLAWETRIHDSLKSMLLSQDALQCLEKIDYPLGRAHALKCYGFALIRLSQNHEAKKCLAEASSIFESFSDQLGQAAVTEYFGIIQRNWGNFAASLSLLKKALDLSQQIKFLEGEATSFYQLGVTYKYLGNYDQALDCYQKCLTISRSFGFTIMEAYSFNIIGAIYFETENYKEALNYYQQGLAIRKNFGDRWGEAGSLDNIGSVYINQGDLQKAEEHCNKSLLISELINDKRGQANSLYHIAQIYNKKGNSEQSHFYLDKSLELRRDAGDRKGEAELMLFRAEILKNEKASESKIQLEVQNALTISVEINAAELSCKAHWAMYESEKRLARYRQSLKHLENFNQIEKKLRKDAVDQKFLNLQISQAAEQSEKEAMRFKIKSEELAIFNNELTRQKEETEKAYQQLKATQTQLIQSEKMASLGQVTAGIAHEIQNPLNFINNFSDVNIELIEELKEDLTTGNRQGALIIANNIKENEHKINHHGKRADAIVKGMLQHSRASTGKKQFTDINVLADEYLRLAYQGQRAKDKSFNVKLVTNFDPTIDKINIVPQDIGRVLLNLYNNAFYAARPPEGGNESQSQNSAQDIHKHQPTIWVKTSKLPPQPFPIVSGGGGGAVVLISVRDNGHGIPPAIVDKIFQPFFTTKPTGQGTGLGLSLSYDIVKAHGGDLKVETKEGEGAKFEIILPTLST